MFQFLANLREKPERERRKFAFVVASSVTGAIFLLWLITLLFTPETKKEGEGFSFDEFFAPYKEGAAQFKEIKEGLSSINFGTSTATTTE